MIVASQEMKFYFEELERQISEIYEIAKKARSLGYDPELEPEIPQAEDLAARVEKLVGPPGVAEVIRGLEKEMPREEMSLKIAEMIVDGHFGRFQEQQAAEQAVRTALAIITEGIAAAAPLEGITHVEIRKNFDGSRYLALYFAGPIRSAGGTAAALAVLTGDFVRRKLYLDPYKPTDNEIERFVEEVDLYATDVAHLQYTPPSADDIRAAVRNIPVEITGEPTGRDVSVTAYRDLERIEHNLVRGGAILALVEGVLQKAPKIMKHVSNLNIDGWEWLSELIAKAQAKEESALNYPKGDKYLDEIIAGRPVFSYPSREGGFRLRYGRARNTGIAAVGIHPAAMTICDDFIAVGTQLKMERPGKGGAVVPVNSIEGPSVKLDDGSVVQVNSVEQALELKDRVSEILSLGDILIGFGEFLENNHPLMPAGWSEDWWAQEVEQVLMEKKFDADLSPYLSPPYLEPTPSLAVELSEKLEVPLHPAYTYLFHDIGIEELRELGGWLAGGEPEFEEGELKGLRLIMNQTPKRVLDVLGVPHRVEDEHVLIEDCALPLCRCLGLLNGQRLTSERLEETLRENPAKDVMEIIQILAGFSVRRKAPTRIGCRMGRPEKANPRLMRPPVHVLFPVSLRGGATRSVIKAAERGEIYVEVARLECPKCGTVCFTRKCPKCGTIANYKKVCPRCKQPMNEERCFACNSRTEYFDRRRIELGPLLNEALQRLQEEAPPEVKGVRGMTSAHKIPEPIEKGVLRAKHHVYVFKDGTVRFDATDVPLTHFRPREVGISVERLRELGYELDYKGDSLEQEDQLVELKVQDIVLSNACAEYLLRASKFVDDLLQKFYGLKPYYNASRPSDLAGHLVIGLAPHTSVGIVGRIIGFTDANVGYAHPFFHAAKRRDCFAHDETLPIFDGNGWRIVKLGEFVEELFKKHKPRETEFGDLIVEVNGYRTLSLNQNYKYELKPITAFSKHSVHDHVVKVVTKDGRELITSGLHSFIDKKQQKVPAFAATHVLRPASFDIPEKEVEQIDLSEYADDNTMVVGAKDLFKRYLKKHGLKATAEKLGIPKTTLFDYCMRDSIPLKILLQLSIQIPEEAKLKTRHDVVVLPRWIKVDKEFLRLLGFYVAEGCCREQEKSFYQVSFAVGRNRGAVEHAISKTFGVFPSRSENAVTISSRLIYNLFERLGCGRSAKEKRVPNFILSLPLKKVKYFLQGYFEGDGGISRGSTPEVACTSASKMLLRDIEFLLTRFGLICSWQKEKRQMGTGKVAEFYKKRRRLLKWICYKLRMHGQTAKGFCEKIGFWWSEKNQKARRILRQHKFSSKRHKQCGSVVISPVKRVEIKNSPQALYNFTVEGTHNAIVSGCSVRQCDGDEDAVILLLDGLLNFSKRFLPSKRGGMMDAPLILNTRINPREIDKEAYNMDVMERYPLEFYEATLRYASPSELTQIMETVERRLGNEEQYCGLKFSFDTKDIAAGPRVSRYKTLETMEEKASAQLGLARKIMAVDERDVAERLIEHHFIPDLKGNLRAFASQQFRCTSCNSKYRRVPLSGQCTRCGGKLILTVTRGGVEKYLQVAMQIAHDYEASDYTKQRLRLTQRDIKSVFESDAHMQMSLADFL